MSEITTPGAPRATTGRSFYDRVRRLVQNPITIKELRSRMRGRRAFVVLTMYLTVMSAFIWLVYVVYYQATRQTLGPESRFAGKAVFAAVLGVQAFVVVFIGPAFTAGAISGEKERQTYDLLRTTLLPPSAIVGGKLLSALSYVVLLVFTSVPLQSLAFLLGGIALEELIISQMLVIVAAITFAMIGLYASTLMRTTLAASVATYAIALFMVIGLPILAMVFVPFIGIAFSGSGTPGWLEAGMLLVGYYLIPTNLPATLLTSELILLEEGSLWFFSTTSSGYTLYFLSPWYLFIVFYLLFSLFLFWLSLRRVRRIPLR